MTTLNLADKIKKSLPQIVLLSCGSFSPITNMHLRIFEEAYNHLKDKFEILRGIISPVHDDYGKSSLKLVTADDRWAMCTISIADNEWLLVDDWEIKNNTWKPTIDVLNYYHGEYNYDDFGPVEIFLLCGSDLVESMSKTKNDSKNFFEISGSKNGQSDSKDQNESKNSKEEWTLKEITNIFEKFSLAVMERQGSNLQDIIDNSILKSYKSKIHIIPQNIENNISSTKVRELIKNNLSVKYLIPDSVIQYIDEHNLYK